MSTNDLFLLQRWTRERDAEAFAEIVSRYSQMVYSTARRILGNTPDAEDVTQQCFLELAQLGERVRVSLGGWLHAMARRRAVDVIRKDSRRRARESAHAQTLAAIEPLDWDRIAELIDEAVDALPEEMREPVVQHFFMGRTHEDIADELGLARSSVTHRIQRGIEEARKFLADRGLPIASAALLAGFSALPSQALPAALVTSLGRARPHDRRHACGDGHGHHVASLAAGGENARGDGRSCGRHTHRVESSHATTDATSDHVAEHDRSHFTHQRNIRTSVASRTQRRARKRRNCSSNARANGRLRHAPVSACGDGVRTVRCGVGCGDRRARAWSEGDCRI